MQHAFKHLFLTPNSDSLLIPILKKQAWRLQEFFILRHPEGLSQYFPCYRSTVLMVKLNITSAATYIGVDINIEKIDLKCSFGSSTRIPVACRLDCSDTEETCINSAKLIQTCLILTKIQGKKKSLSPSRI